MSHIYGMPVHISPDICRYQLPEELIPGVPWNPEFRREINSWAKQFFSSTNLVKDGEVLKFGEGYNAWLAVNPRTYAQLKLAWEKLDYELGLGISIRTDSLVVKAADS